MSKACASGKQPASPKKVNKKNKWLVGVLVLAGLVLLLGIGYIAAKYLANSAYETNQVVPKSFYFTVDMLGDTVPDSQEHPLTQEFDIYGGGQKTLTFNVQNYFDDARINEDQIAYTASISDKSTFNHNLTLTYNGNAATQQTMAGGEKISHEYTLVIPGGYKDEDKVIVTVASSKPYAKTMTLVFVLHDHKAPVSYRMEDRVGSNYATLYLMFNEDVAKGNMDVVWSSIAEEIFIDTTSEYILDENQTLTTNNPADQNGTLETATITKKMEAESSILIYFFKADPSKDYSTLPVGEDKAADYIDSTYIVNLGVTQ